MNCTFLYVIMMINFFLFLFFFSSRRRHTRSKRDWSSDVCSSDLPCPYARPEDMDKVVHGLETNTYTYLAPVIIPAANIPQAQGLANGQLTLMAIKDGKLKEIPFQIDEYDNTGLIWVNDISKNDPEGKPGTFDGFDELIFMYRDAGLEPLTHSSQPNII